MKNKTFLIIIVACIALVITFVLLTSYAYWRVTKKQTGTNNVLTACLDIELEEDLDKNGNKIEGFTLENAWPITDEEGMSLSGYHFTVVNKCFETVKYEIVLDSLSVDNSDNQINNQFIKVALDDGEIRKYGKLNNANSDDVSYNPIASKEIYFGVIPPATSEGYGRVQHTIRIWISDDALNQEISKQFISKVRVIADKGYSEPEYPLTPESCFDFDSETGTITDYHENECTKEYIVLPPTINGVKVKSIDFLDHNTDWCGDCIIRWKYVSLTKAIWLETIGNGVFQNYVGTGQELVIPNSVKTIGWSAFANYDGTDILMGNNLERIGMGAFQQYEGFGQTLKIPDSVIIIESDAFGIFQGKKIILGNNLETIEENAFEYYNGDTFKIPSSIQFIYSGAFGYYTGDVLINMSKDDFYPKWEGDWISESATLYYRE